MGKSMRLIYGTGNPGKFHMMQDMLRGTQIELVSLREALEERRASLRMEDEEPLEVTPPEESGSDPLENARQKAEFYFALLRRPVFSCDSGLFIEGLPDEEQPGVHVRNVNGRRLTDQEMTEHYRGIAARLGGKCRARYQNAICLILDEGHRYEYAGKDISGDDFYLVEQAMPQAEEGFPLEPISVDIRSGRCFVEEESGTRSQTLSEGMRRFFDSVCFDRGRRAL